MAKNEVQTKKKEGTSRTPPILNLNPSDVIQVSMDFNELVPGAIVRYTFIDGVQYLSVRDLIMVTCNQDIDRAGKTWRNLTSFKLEYDLQNNIKFHKFNGRGQQDQPVVSIKAATMIVQFLPGDTAKLRRGKALEILESHGDCLFDMTLPVKKRRLMAPESYVYLLHSAAFPDYVKIGYTKNIRTRLHSINSVMPEHPYELVSYFSTFDPVADEAEAHKHFAKYRTVREFFKMPKEEAIPYFEDMKKLHDDNC